ncbi:MAG: flagellar hook-length control protein FliK [Moorella humiferrea]|nr:flagellar hook-length control protein FliK [Moorella humiferrea]
MTVQAVKKIDVKEIQARDRDRPKGDGGDFALYLAGLVQQNPSARPAEKSGPEGGAARGVAEGTGVGKSTGEDGSPTVTVPDRHKGAVAGMKAVPLEVFLQGKTGEGTGAGLKDGVFGVPVNLTAEGGGMKGDGKAVAPVIVLERAAEGYGTEAGLKAEAPGDVLNHAAESAGREVGLKAEALGTVVKRAAEGAGMVVGLKGEGRRERPAAAGNDPLEKHQAGSMALRATALHKGEEKAPVAGGDAAAADVDVKGYPATVPPDQGVKIHAHDGSGRAVPTWQNKLSEAVSALKNDGVRLSGKNEFLMAPSVPEQGFKGGHGDAGSGKDAGTDGFHVPLSASAGLKPEVLPAGKEGSPPLLRNLSEITSAVLEAARVTRSTGRQELEIRLQPENLGHMKLTASLMEGRLVVHFLVENREAARILQAAVPEMRQTLIQQGFHLDQVQVQVGGEGSGGSQAWEQGAREWGPRRPPGRTPVPPGGGEGGIYVGSWHRFDYLA